jgi:hypothetical protein
MKLFKSSDRWTNIVILLTVGLFSVSLAVKGFTHELFLEAGVFLVSAKLILMAAKTAESEKRLERQLTQIKALLARDTASVAINEETSARNANDRIRQIC